MAILPAGWDAITIERIWLGDRSARLHVEHGRPAAITWL
jgi:hypothetical protein